MNKLKTLAAGAIAGAVSRTVVSPAERIKILFQTQPHPPKYTSVTQALRLIYFEEGLVGYFKGNGANVLRIAPATAIQFYSYERYKLVPPPPNRPLRPSSSTAAPR
jgi:solute carrier family 25 (mitochondrial phosphate transporter), member 23/24/25/41